MPPDNDPGTVLAHRDGENPIRAFGRIAAWLSGVLNDPEVQETGDAFFAAMTRASNRQLELVKSDGTLTLNKGDG